MSTLTIKATNAWLILVSLTLLSLVAQEVLENPGVLVLIVVLTVMIKGQHIVDVFMGLKTAPATWRWLLLSYVIAVPALIGAIMVWL